MPFLNYTTSIIPEKSLAEITKTLIAHGATRIMTEIGPDKRPTGLAFTINTAHGERAFRLPVRVEGVQGALTREYKQRKVERRMTEPAHAEKVAWRLLKEWVDVQIAYVESGSMTIDEAMLSFMVVKGSQTVYQVMNEHRLALPAPELEDE